MNPLMVHRSLLPLLAASILGLFFEMIVVRWLSAEVRLFSYFKNFALMASFLGLGLGFGLARAKRDYRAWFLPLTGVFVALVLAFGHVTAFGGLVVPESDEFMWRTAPLPTAFSAIIFVAVLLIFFMLTVLLFLPLGQLAGARMVGVPPIRAYLVNLTGSLLGIWAYAGLAFTRAPPWIWFALGLLLFLLFLPRTRTSLGGGLLLSAGIVSALIWGQGDSLWSPYYRVDILSFRVGDSETPTDSSWELFVNRIGHMFAVDLSPSALEGQPDPQLQVFSTLYNLPVIAAQPERVLVLGAGMGNDIAAALRHGARQVVAVEIDPVIHEAGLRLHPEHPYSSPNVTVVVDDARAFLARSEEKFDLIAFGILDSQTLLSGMASVRLDNFIYTEEAMVQARDHLSTDGVLALTFDVERWWIGRRLADGLAAAFGRPPLAIAIEDTPWRVLLEGPDSALQRAIEYCRDMSCRVDPEALGEPVPLATDDWPYLYLERKSIPAPYWAAIAVILGAGWAATRRALPGRSTFNLYYFLLGGAFLLLEFKILTELALLFGSTWLVNAIGISAVLLLVMLANLVAPRLGRVDTRVLYALLFLSLLVGYGLPLQGLLGLAPLIRAAASSALLGSPLFFAALLFARALARSPDAAGPLASSLLGSAFGGVLEYASLIIGISGLALLAAGLYLLSAFSVAKQDPG